MPSHGLGVARARNDGLRAAANDVVLVTDDDCTVPADWASTGWRLATAHPGAIVTGRVLPVGDPRAVPSTKDDPLPRDLSGERRGGWLFGNNMVLPRIAVLELGGFDERFGPEEAAEDNEFCYRWLQGGPPAAATSRRWSSTTTTGAAPTSSSGCTCGTRAARASSMRSTCAAAISGCSDSSRATSPGGCAASPPGLLKGRESWTDSRRGILSGLPGGFAAGWRVYGKER